MTLEEALDWADMNFTPEATGDLHNKWVMKTLADEVRSMQGADEACKEVERALEGLPYKGTYAQQIQQMRLDMATLQALVGGSDDVSQALIDEREALAAQNQQMREALKATQQVLSANGDNFGKWAQLKAIPALALPALALPDLATDILRKRDAKVLRSAVERLFVLDFTNKSDRWLRERCCETLSRMADELESGK